MQHIYPIFDTILQRSDKEKSLNQKAIVIWMVGLSGSGKSTLAKSLEQNLHQKGYFTKLLDGDNLRSGINNNLAFSLQERKENIRRAAEVSKLFLQTGIVTICSLISPTEEVRSMAKEIIGNDDYFEVFVNAPLEVCEARDVKGLYAKARRGEIKNFTGIDSVFEEPSNPSLEIRTDQFSVEECLEVLVNTVLQRINLN